MSTVKVSQAHSKVYQQVHSALCNGTLVKPDHCSECGWKVQGRKRRLVAHHPDYSKPLDVVWLCRPCHDAEHKRLNACA